MQKLRALHLYLGCVFAPLLLFFAVSGIWQMTGLGGSRFLRTLSTIHTSHQYKDGSGLTSPLMMLFVLLMAVSFIVSILLGVVMAWKFGRNRKTVFACLAFGVICPAVLVLLRMHR
jgi:hypothetical protein